MSFLFSASPYLHSQVAFDRHLIGSICPSVSRYDNDVVQHLLVFALPCHYFALAHALTIHDGLNI